MHLLLNPRKAQKSENQFPLLAGVRDHIKNRRIDSKSFYGPTGHQGSLSGHGQPCGCLPGLSRRLRITPWKTLIEDSKMLEAMMWGISEAAGQCLAENTSCRQSSVRKGRTPHTVVPPFFSALPSQSWLQAFTSAFPLWINLKSPPLIFLFD